MCASAQRLFRTYNVLFSENVSDRREATVSASHAPHWLCHHNCHRQRQRYDGVAAATAHDVTQPRNGSRRHNAVRRGDLAARHSQTEFASQMHATDFVQN